MPSQPSTPAPNAAAIRSSRPIISIEDPADPRIGVFRDIRERDLTGRHGFIAEGTVVLDQLALSTRFRPSACLILENRLSGIADRLARLPADCPIYVAPRDVIDAIAGFPLHRGVLAHGVDMGAERTLDETLDRVGEPKRPLLVCIGIANHDNAGALFRNARAFGAGAVLLDETSCNPLYRKALRVSTGTVLSQVWHRGGTAAAILRAVRERGYQPTALTPHADATLSDLDGSRPCALFVGAEGPGLPDALLAEMRGIRIAMAADVDSLNVATSAAIALSRLYGAP